MRITSLLLQLAMASVASAGASHASHKLSQALVKKAILLGVALVCGVLALVFAFLLALLWLAPALSLAEAMILITLLLIATALGCYTVGRDIRTLKALEDTPAHGLGHLGNLATAFKRGWEQG